MTNFIPIFPLPVIVFPGEKLNLHIFENQYKQLITDCHTSEKNFGIPVVLKKEIKELGTLMKIESIEKVYDNGDMDIRTAGVRIFRILESISDIPGKLYKGAIVHYPENNDNGRPHLMNRVITSVRLLHHLLSIKKDFKKPDDQLRSFDIAHHVGLSPAEEYEILGYTDELHRQEYLRRHLTKTIPVISETEKLKEKVKMNGHFRDLKGLQ